MGRLLKLSNSISWIEFRKNSIMCEVFTLNRSFLSFRSGSIILKYMINMKSNDVMGKTEMHQDVFSTIQSNSASLSAMSITMEPVENVLTSVGGDLNFCHCEVFWSFERKTLLDDKPETETLYFSFCSEMHLKFT